MAVATQPKTVDLGTLAEGDTFTCPWRSEGKHVGTVKRSGMTVAVRVPKHDGDGWEEAQWAEATQVVPGGDMAENYPDKAGSSTPAGLPPRVKKVEGAPSHRMPPAANLGTHELVEELVARYGEGALVKAQRRAAKGTAANMKAYKAAAAVLEERAG